MPWLSEHVELLVERELAGSDGKPKVHTAVVVGSGYGGAVSALRLAEAGIDVLVLERGKEYLPGDFPNDVGEAFGHVRLERDRSDNINGYESGLYDLRLGDGIGALVGNALGGTSQINANVVLQPDPRVFTKSHDGKPAWPQQLASAPGAAMPPDLQQAFELARAVLAPETFGDKTELNAVRPYQKLGARVQPLKRMRLKELEAEIRGRASEVKVRFDAADVTVNLGTGAAVDGVAGTPCKGCGECVSGCNWFSKKTLTASYLPQAKHAGARMFTGVSVLSVEKSGDHWIVHFVRTETRKMQRDGVQVPVHQLHAKHVVLSAGTFGSTEILLRSNKERDLDLSEQLGRRLSTNGDSLAFGYLMTKRVNGSGIGSTGGKGDGFAVGPTITAMIRVDHPTDVTRSMLIEDGAIPSVIGGLFHELVATSATLAQLDRHTYRDLPPMGQPTEQATDWAVLQPRGRTHTLTLLGMGHDPSAGKIWLDTTDRLRIKYPTAESNKVQALHTGYMRHVEALGAIYLANPALEPLPDGVSDVLSGPPMENGTLTVHPLGGCCMGDGTTTGVVDHLGRVFNGTGAGLHQGLYVLDGSIVPTSLGANPLFTITALAERAMATLAPAIAAAQGKQPASRSAAPALFPYTAKPPLNPYAREVNVNFTEAMRASKGGLRWGEENCDAHLLLQMPVSDLELFGTDGRHLIIIPNQVGAARGDKEQLTPHMNIDLHVPPLLCGPRDKVRARLDIESGWVSILPVPVRRWLAWDLAWLRTALTWWIERGFDEVMQMLPGLRPADAPKVNVRKRICGFVKMVHHASENRVMEYHLRLRDATPRKGDSVRTYTLLGTKNVGYAASWGALARYMLHITRPLDRANVWKAFGLLKVKILDEDNKLAGSGVLELDMLDMTRMHAPQLGPQRDTPNALIGLASYPMWFARLLMKTRLWDFRLPDYPTHVPAQLIPRAGRKHKPRVPVPANNVETETPWPDFPKLRIVEGNRTRNVEARPSEELVVPRRKPGTESARLKLTRYPQPTIGAATHDGITQVKVMLMLNGFAQSTLGFVPEEHVRKPGAKDDEPGLAEFFYEQGYDVWLFDYRTSAILEESKQPCTMDDIAAYDIPGAVDHVRDVVAAELKLQAQDVRIFAFAHCVGAASMAMSLLGGHLKDRLAGVTFSQMQAFLVGSRTAQMRLRVGGILRDTLGIDYMRLSAAERKPTVLESMLDRLFASLPVDPGEHCPNEYRRLQPRPEICTCKRMSGTISRLLKHDRLKPQTHDRLAVYFGRANTSLLVHGGRCVENERLVNADGQNVYVTDDNIREHLDLPVAFLHGAHNALFDVESAHRTHDQVRRVLPALDAAGVCRKIVAKDYGHFDCTIGYGVDMQEQILQPLRKFYADAWNYHLHPVAPATPALEPRSLAKAPLSGPVIGWNRVEDRAGKPVRVVRLWIEVDESESLKADWVVTHTLRVNDHSAEGMPDKQGGARTQLWPVIRVPFDHAAVETLEPHLLATQQPYIAIGLADLEFDLGEPWGGDIRVLMFSVHSALFAKRPDNAQVAPPSLAAPWVPDPLTPDELERAAQDGSLPMFIPAGWGLQPFGFTGPAIRHTGSDGRTIPSAGSIAPEHGLMLWNGLIQQQQKAHDLAQQADPGTLSRKRRLLALPILQPKGIASLQQETIRAPLADSGLVFVAACCRHPGLAFEDRRSDATFARIRRHVDRAAAKPAFMLMLGDQIYADATAGLMDSPSAAEKVVISHQRAFGTAAFIDLTSRLPTYMVIDDHEIGDNWTTDLVAPINKAMCNVRLLNRLDDASKLFATARSAFTAYQWAHGPRNGNVAPPSKLTPAGAVHPKAPGFNFHFSDGGCEFFVLDTRTSRTRFSTPPQVCHPAQLVELERWLDQFDPADKRPKFIVSGSVLAPGLRMALTGDPAISDRTVDTWQMAQQQRSQVLEAILQRSVRNVVFLAGDYHCAATATLDFEGTGLRAYAIVTPPLYAQLPAANVKPWQVTRERIPLSGGRTVTSNTSTSAGDGFVEVRALPLPSGKWQLELRYDQMNSAEKANEAQGHARTLILD